MTDIWETKNIRPMLIGTEGQPFDSDEYIYELKLDGERCIAYLDDSEEQTKYLNAAESTGACRNS
jgi:ATP-dependent DNA ligase